MTNRVRWPNIERCASFGQSMISTALLSLQITNDYLCALEKKQIIIDVHFFRKVVPALDVVGRFSVRLRQ